MRNGRFAEALLSLLAPADHAASAVGDLMEEAHARGRFWFWQSVARLAASWLVRDLVAAPLAMIGAAMFSWFLYMGLFLVLSLGGYLVVTVIWGAAYVLAHHTGFELLADVLRVRFDWPPIPAWATYAIQALVLFAIAPFRIGRGSARYWRGHELGLVLVMLLIWSGMAVIVPIVGIGIAVTPRMMPLVVAFLFIGILSNRRRATLSLS